MVPNNKIPIIKDTSDKDIDVATNISTTDKLEYNSEQDHTDLSLTHVKDKNYEFTQTYEGELIEWSQSY